jgi:glycine/D-amino acid oxidase-like deaminating enzyme
MYYDFIIVGAGIAGIFTAMRLAAAGAKVALFERTLVGSEASGGNHGLIHRGALYLEDHPEIVNACGEAIELFRSTFPNAVRGESCSWYWGEPDLVGRFKKSAQNNGIPYADVETAAVQRILRPNDALQACVEVPDLVVSARQILVQSTQACLNLGVDIILSPVNSILVRGRKAVGVSLGVRETISCRRGVVLCAGLGLHELTMKASPNVFARLTSRLCPMLAYDNIGLTRPVYSLKRNELALAPTADGGTVLVSLFGGFQPPVHRYAPKTAVSLAITAGIANKLNTVAEGLLDIRTGRAYNCSKTEAYSGGAFCGPTNPAPVIFNHAVSDGISNLWTLVPGKLTLAFHGSQRLVQNVLGGSQSLHLPIIPPNECHSSADLMVAESPWVNKWPRFGEAA